jgi:hypothetical protein
LLLIIATDKWILEFIYGIKPDAGCLLPLQTTTDSSCVQVWATA